MATVGPSVISWITVFDVDRISDLMTQIYDGTHSGIDGITIVRNGTLLLEANVRTSLDQFDSWIGNLVFLHDAFGSSHHRST